MDTNDEFSGNKRYHRLSLLFARRITSKIRRAIICSGYRKQLGLSHSTIHNLFQRFNASGIVWSLPDSLSFAQLNVILYANRKKELTEPQISEGTWRTSYSREFKIRLVKQALQPSAVFAWIVREHNINDNLLFNWKRQYEEGLLNDEDQLC